MGGTSVRDSTLKVSVLSFEMREMVGCGAGMRLGDKLAVSASVLLLPGFELCAEESSAAGK